MMKESPARHRFFAEGLTGDTVALSPAEAHHVGTVLRLSPGDTVELFDGAGTVAAGTIERVAGREAMVHVRTRRTRRTRPEPVVTLAFAPPKGRRLDWLLEKATELGTARLAPVIFARSVAVPRLPEHAARRWRGICVAAAKQCGAEFLPEIVPPRPVAEFLRSAGEGLRILGDAGGDRALPEALGDWQPGEPVTILIGPEGGCTDGERGSLQQAGFRAVRLGELVLRVETAAVGLLVTTTVLCQSVLTGPGGTGFTRPPDSLG
jgi:16S rRNA (uracil1498-N3)-methyltransferase